MDFVTEHIDWIEVICGPMFSGKSEELIRRLRRPELRESGCRCSNPVLDDRYSCDQIVSHGDIRMPSEVVADASEIPAKLDPRTEVIGIDESNFMKKQLVDVATRLADSRHPRISGVDHQDPGDLYAVRKSR